jgi:hypothetical protein
LDLTAESPRASAEQIRGLRSPEDPGGADFTPDVIGVGFFDFNDIVKRAADRYEQEHPNVLVSNEARRVLIDRAKDHEAEIVAAMKRDGLTAADLENAAFAQLGEAHNVRRADFAPGQRIGIDARSVEVGMSKMCWYVGWC